MKAKSIFLFICVAVFSISGISQKASLTGTVRTSAGQPLPGAAVYVHDVKTGNITDSLGRYRIPSLPAGHYLVEVSHLGYSAVTEAITISGNAVHDFVLEEAVVEHQGVIVTGVATATKLRQATQPVSLIRKPELLKTVSTNIIDVLAKEPGVSVLSTGPAIAKPVIRGLGYNRMVVINDGVRQEGQQWGDEHGIEVDEYSIQRAEILKGPASLMYGSDAMAGVINLMTNVPVAQGTIRGNLLTSWMHNNDMIGVNLNLAGHDNTGFNWNVYGSHKAAGDYRNRYDGRVFNSRFNEKNFGGYIGLNKSWGFSHLLFSNFHQQTGMIEGERDSATGKFLIFPESTLERIATEEELNSKTIYPPYQDIRHMKLVSDNNFRLPRGRINVLLSYQQNKRREYGDPLAPAEPELFFDLQTINYNLQYHSPNSKNSWATSIGVNGMYQQNRNRAEEVLIPEYRQFDIGAFVYTRRSFSKVTVSGGLRADLRQLQADEFIEGSDVKFSAFKKSFSNLSGSIGISYDLDQHLTLKANVARAFRAPNIAELSSNGAHEGTNRYEYGQQELSSETSLQLDAGLELNTDHFSFSIAGFYNNIQNYVFYRKLTASGGGDSLVNVDGEDLTAFRFDQSAASLYGAELSFDIHPHPLDWLHFENSFSYVRGKFHSAIEGNSNLSFMPPAKWNSELRTDFKMTGKRLGNLYLKLEMEHVLEQNRIFTAYNTETETPSYTLLHFGAGTDFRRKGNTLFTLHFAVNNLGDAAYQSHLSRLKYTAVNNVTGREGVFGMGRNYSVRLNIPLSFRTR